MRRFLTAILLSVSLLLAGGCQGYLNVSEEPELVVEAWIEDGGYPVVIVTSSVTHDELPADLESLEGHMVRWAKVWMSDGNKTVNLTGVPSDKYFPPYVYTSSQMRGESGKRYELVVEYGNVRVTGSTVIPESVPIDYVELVHDRDSLFNAYVRFTSPEGTNRYRFFVSLDDGYWAPALFGTFALDSSADEQRRELLRRGYSYEMRDYVSSFVSGENVELKLCTLNEEMFDYWMEFDNNIFYGRTPFFPAKSNPIGNLQGASGYFTGYGCSTTRFTVPR